MLNDAALVLAANAVDTAITVYGAAIDLARFVRD